MIDLKKLEVFIKVYEIGNFSKVSQLLYLSQPTITIHIKDLEETFGVKLLDRHTRKVIPTKAGKLVYEYGKEILNLFKKMEKDLLPFKEEEGGLIELGGSTIPGHYLLPKIIREFKKLYPKIMIFLKVGDTEEIIEKVWSGFLEFGVVGAMIKNKDLIFKPCFQDQIVLISPLSFKGTEIELKEIYEIPLIKREEGSGTWKTVVEALEKEGIEVFRLNLVGEMGSTEAVKEAVKSELGWGFVSLRAVELETKLNLLKVVSIKNFKIFRNFYLIYPKFKNFTPSAKLFLEFFQKNTL
ncbi:MAG: selenium metabolism-associated LysR family transcriptional regulator [Thermodesulfobacteriaceae bacterium]|nr:selenium metabolism-associated LysR family transcriptional regulator [Thermodesulfobacteriaceae bacterium]MDW8136273.1 selenium metabolism-associated LysR family transcriptional regulator [Thermodesulfobacterium sp.]